MSQRVLSPQQFFHGSRRPLKPGDILTGGHPSNFGNGVPDTHVYFTPHKDVAREFAEAGLGPDHDPDAPPRLYHVEPIGEHEPDPDEAPGVSFKARQARVVRRVR